MKSMNVTYCLAIAILFLCSFQSCTNDIILPDREICFEEEVLPILQTSCTYSGCHNANDRESNIDLTSYVSIFSYKHIVNPGDFKNSDLYIVLGAFGEKRMPTLEYEPLSDDQIATIAIWIKQGAKNITCNIQCDTTNVTYSRTVKPIFELHCKVCHNKIRHEGGLDFSDFSQVSDIAFDGSLVGSIEHNSKYVPMPQQANKLSLCNINKIKQWIAYGALEN